MLLESKSALSSAAPPAAPAAKSWFSIFLLRFARTHSVWTGFAGLWAAYAISAAFYLYESGLPVLSPMLLLCLIFGTVLVCRTCSTGWSPCGSARAGWPRWSSRPGSSARSTSWAR